MPNFSVELRKYYKLFVAIIIPLLLLPLLLLVEGKESRCGYCVVIMATFWMLELVPLPVTALFPLVLFPATGVLSAAEVSLNYFKDSNVLIFSGLVFAVAIESWNLHKRVALRTLMITGSNQRTTMLGFMFVAWFLSGFLNNTATAAMLMPIASAVAEELNPKHKIQAEPVVLTETAIVDNVGTEETSMSQKTCDERRHYIHQEEMRKYITFKKALTLSIAYACNIGGSTTLTGTPPNVMLAGVVTEKFNSDTGLNFGTFMIYCLPQSIVCLIYTWGILQLVFFPLPCRKKASNENDAALPASYNLKEIVRQQYQMLGPFRTVDKLLCTAFCWLVTLWLFRDPKFIGGWSEIFSNKHFISDGTVGVFICLLLFFIPSFEYSHNRERYRPILQWSVVQQKLEWGLIILLGGGFAMAAGIKSSGLDLKIMSLLTNIVNIDRRLLAFIVVVSVGCMTEFTSNTSTAAIVQPLLATLAVNARINPFFLMIPATVACSFAFCLPVATPPNAIAYTHGGISVPEMIKAGIFLNLGCFIVATISACTWGNVIFEMNTFPSWVNETMEP